MQLDELWRQVVESPDDVGLRLVLADALIEQGDPRGELIALQCRGADARVVVDREVDDENPVERVNELVANNWDVWLGDDLRQIVVRQGSAYHDGMLLSVQVGDTDAPRAVWERAAKHRELCAVQRVRPFKARSDPYGVFLAALVHDPTWVEISSPHVIRVLRMQRKRWAVRQVRYGGIAFWRDNELRGVLTSEMQMLSEVAVALEVVELNASWLGEELLQVVLSIQKLFPKLEKLRVIDQFGNMRRNADAAQLALIEAMPFAEILDRETD